jgi:hypothetical protein
MHVTENDNHGSDRVSVFTSICEGKFLTSCMHSTLAMDVTQWECTNMTTLFNYILHFLN